MSDATEQFQLRWADIYTAMHATFIHESTFMHKTCVYNLNVSEFICDLFFCNQSSAQMNLEFEIKDSVEAFNLLTTIPTIISSVASFELSFIFIRHSKMFKRLINFIFCILVLTNALKLASYCGRKNNYLLFGLKMNNYISEFFKKNLFDCV